MMYSQRHPLDMEQWSRLVAPTSSRQRMRIESLFPHDSSARLFRVNRSESGSGSGSEKKDYILVGSFDGAQLLQVPPLNPGPRTPTLHPETPKSTIHNLYTRNSKLQKKWIFVPYPHTPTLETRNPKPETRNLKPETRDPKPETRNPKPEARNPKSESRNPKPETREQGRLDSVEALAGPSALAVNGARVWYTRNPKP